MAKRALEPVLWLLFSAGGVASAPFLPALVFLFAFAVPLGWIEDPGRDRLLGLIGHPLTALVLLGVCRALAPPLGAAVPLHPFDGLKLKPHQRPINTGVYALALLGSAAAVVVLWQAPRPAAPDGDERRRQPRALPPSTQGNTACSREDHTCVFSAAPPVETPSQPDSTGQGQKGP